MIHHDHGGVTLEHDHELPELPDSIKVLTLDLETTSRDPRKKSLNPHKDCWVAGIGVTWDDHPTAYYVPVGHAEGFGHNLSWEAVRPWLERLLEVSQVWENHNVKYDRLVLARCVEPRRWPHLRCTLTGAKLRDSDMLYKGGYDLGNLSRRWCGEDISGAEAALQPFLGKANKDYGRVPTDIMGYYCCQDCLSNRRLGRFIEATLPDEVRWVWQLEQRLTAVLVKMELRGVRVVPDQLKREELRLLGEILRLEEWIQETTGQYVRAHSNEDCHELLCGRYGLPVVSWTEDDDGRPLNPSFDKEALKKYLVLPNAPTKVVRALMLGRKKSTLKSFFVEPYQEKHVDGVLHPWFNARVRTGRMSCKDPNAQQLSPEAKELIHARDGYVLVRCDYSQVEFRIIAHYIEDRRIIQAYLDDPDTDFHQAIADQTGQKRKAAKTVNLAAGYGMGEEKTCRTLSMDEDVMSDIRDKVKQAVDEGKIDPSKAAEAFHTLARRKAKLIYRTYHENMPTLKSTARQAANTAKARGYVRTAGRARRHLTREAARLAFNATCQGTAADGIKERMVALDESGLLERHGAYMLLQVHDELVFEVPVGNERAFCEDVVPFLEDWSAMRLSVPIRCKYCWGRTWAEASDERAEMSVPYQHMGQFVNGENLVSA